jgi:Cu-processing system permease protein
LERATIAVIASQELKTSIRSRWTVTFAGVFAALALAISYFGLITQGVAGFQGFTRTAASMLNLVLYLVPLVGLTMGSLSLTVDKGANELLFAQPVSRTDVLMGKALGAFASLSLATTFGFGVAGAIVAGQVGYEGVMDYLAMGALALVLAFIFIGLGMMLAAVLETRARAFGATLAVWFFFVLFYDLLALGLTLLLEERTGNAFLFVSLFGNPVELIRVSTLLLTAGESIFGAAGAALVKFLGGRAAAFVSLAVALSFWSAMPLWFAARILNRRDL